MTLSPILLNVCEPCREGRYELCESPRCFTASWMSGTAPNPTPTRSRDEMIEAGAAVVHRILADDLVCRNTAEAVLIAAGVIEAQP